MQNFAEHIIHLFTVIHPLDRIPRAGFLLRGVSEAESISAHSHFMSLLALLYTDAYPGSFDQKKVLAMTIVHDLPEAITMDIPMPAGDRYLKDAKTRAEQDIIETMFQDFPAVYAEYHRELNEGQSPEARLVKALDKVQMMLKVLCYQREGRGNLDEFWEYEKNFFDYEIPGIRELFEAIRKAAGKEA